MSQQILIERFYDTLISGDRPAARQVVDECIEADAPAEQILEKLIFPTLEMVQRLYRQDQLSVLCHHYATRLLRMIADQMQMRLEQQDRRGETVLLLCGPEEPDELAGQMAADILEARGFDVRFAGGGVANDEIISQIGQLDPSRLVLFGSTPRDLPYIRQLIDRLHEMNVCPRMQIVVGGGVFNRADGLAEEIGADAWGRTPLELAQVMDEQAQRRMDEGQRTVGRRRRQPAKATSAA